MYAFGAVGLAEWKDKRGTYMNAFEVVKLGDWKIIAWLLKEGIL